MKSGEKILIDCGHGAIRISAYHTVSGMGYQVQAFKPALTMDGVTDPPESCMMTINHTQARYIAEAIMDGASMEILCSACGMPEYHCTEGHAIQPKDWEAVEQLRQMLRNAREKLVLYRQVHSGEYIGGVEFHTLIRSIDAALTPASGGTEHG